MTLILITGGCGFIGHHLVEHIYRNTDWNIVIIDKLTYASRGLDRLRNIGILNCPRLQVFTFDLCEKISDGLAYELKDVEYIVHMAADTHVDNSIKEPVPFIYNNVMSTVNILEYARSLKRLKKLFYFSTDEVYGPALGKTSYKEWDRHRPTNPYSASKSASENICISYENTYKLPIIVINVMNAFGERQHVEKFIPKIIKYLLENKEIEIHSDEFCQNPGSRFYIHSRNISDAVLFLINKGEIGEKYNVVGDKEINNLEMVQIISKLMNIEPKYKLVNFHSDRPGHDLRYSLNGEKLRSLGWNQPKTFEETLKKTLEWTLKNKEWLEWS